MEQLRGDDPTHVGGYRLRARLGSGGMGAVYLAYSPGGQPLAVKVIRQEYAASPDFRRRFAREVAAARRVQGPYTAPVVDSDTEGPQPWLAGVYVPGPALDAVVAGHGPLPVRTVLQLTAGVAEALGAIHAAGVVHRDLKPSNVLLAAEGPRVIDFGIARSADATQLTEAGELLGTPAYMAPEQITGDSPPGAAIDVFALGLLTHYAATGAHPYGEASGHALLFRIATGEPQLSGCPAEVRELVARCLAKDPAARPSPAEVIEHCRASGEALLERATHGWLPPWAAAEATRQAELTERLPREGAVAGGPVAGGPVAGGPVAGGPVAGGPVAGGPVAGGPVADATPAAHRQDAGSYAQGAGPYAQDAGPYAQGAGPYAQGGASTAPAPAGRPPRRRTRTLVAIATALAVATGGTVAFLQFRDGDGGGSGSGGATADGPLGNILVAGRPVTGSAKSGDGYRRTYSDGELYAPVTGYRSRAFGNSQLEQFFGEELNRAGTKVATTIEPDVQRAAAKGLKGAANGAAIALDPDSGEILALVNTPSYDPGSFSGNDTRSDSAWKRLTGSGEKPLLNRALREALPPGAAFQPVVAAAALDDGLVQSIDDPTESPSPYVLPQSTTRVPNPPGAPCRNADLRTALQYSCTAVFAKLADDLGQKKLRAAAERLGFNDPKPSVPVPAGKSIFPTATNRPMSALSGTGQGNVRATPLQLAMVTAAIANDGRLSRPYLVSRATDPDGKVVFRPAGKAARQVLNPLTAKEMRDLLVTAVEKGTGKPAAVPDVEVGGKAGDAAVVGKAHERRVGWFVSYADGGDRKVAVAVVREERGGGSGDIAGASQAARTARDIIKAAVGPED